MILHGDNLFIKVNGEVLAAAKTCKVQVQSNTIGVSSPTDGQWEHSIPGRKSWSVSTGHLMVNMQKALHTIKAVSNAYNGVSCDMSYVVVNGQTYTDNLTGILIVVGNTDMTLRTARRFDTYTNQQSAQAAMLDFVQSDIVGTNRPWAIITHDKFKLDTATRTALIDALEIDGNVPVVANNSAAWVAIGVDSNGGISSYQLGDGATVHTELLLGDNNIPIAASPIRDAIRRVGQTMEITLEVEGLFVDRLTGQAICTQFETTATKGTLLQGTYTWKGSGPLE